VMTTEVRSVRASVPVRQAVESLVGQAFRALPVVDDSGRLVGVVSNRDLVERGGLEARIELLSVMGERDREQYLKRLPDQPVSAVMTPDPLTAKPTTTLAEATRLLSERRIKRLPIVEPTANSWASCPAPMFCEPWQRRFQARNGRQRRRRRRSVWHAT